MSNKILLDSSLLIEYRKGANTGKATIYYLMMPSSLLSAKFITLVFWQVSILIMNRFVEMKKFN